MPIQQTIKVEGLAANGIPVGELGEFLDTARRAGTGVHQPVTIAIEKVKGGEDLISLTVEIGKETEDVLPPAEEQAQE